MEQQLSQMKDEQTRQVGELKKMDEKNRYTTNINQFA